MKEQVAPYYWTKAWDQSILNAYQPKVLDESISATHRLQGVNDKLPWINHMESHSVYEIYVFTEGECKYFIHDQIYDLQPGDIILLDGFTLHKANTPSPDTYVRSMVHFSPAWLEKFLPAMGIPNLLDPFKRRNNCILRTGFDESGRYVDDKIKGIAEQLREIDLEFQSTGQINEMLKSELTLNFLQLLLKLYKMSEGKDMRVKRKKTEKKRHAENIATWINQHFSEKVSLERISEEQNLNKYYISHVFKEVTGYTVMQYVMECRLAQAKYLLEMRLDQSLEEIFLSTGFESGAHFSRFFKEKTGMTPTKYRKMKNSKLLSNIAQW